MIQPRRGFTLVELILAISVIAILAAITLFVWGSVATWSRNQARQDDTNQWAATFNIYKARFFVYPALPVNSTTPTTMCLGSFSAYNNKCGQYNSSTAGAYIAASGAAYTSFITEVQKIGKLQINSEPTIDNVLVGPLVYLTQNVDVSPITVTAKYIDFFQGNCPTDYTDISASLPSSISGVLSGLPATTSAKVCALTKTFTY